jgi:tripartite-type tricarboxylate transporter receptor subunit TctC
MRKLLQRLCGVLLLSGITCPAVLAQSYPTRNVELIVPYGPGGSTDIVARLFAQKLQERLGQAFIVFNRPELPAPLACRQPCGQCRTATRS